MSGLSLTIHQSTQSTRIWALVPGIREWVLVALVVVALYGRTDRIRRSRVLAPLGRLVRSSGLGRFPALYRFLVDRWQLVFALLAGTGVLAWFVTSLRVTRSWAGH